MYRKALTAKVASAGFGVMALGAIIVLHTGTAYAVPLAGIGGFQVQADEIRGYGAYIYGGADDTSSRDAIPMGVTELQRAEIDGLRLIKTQSMSSVPGLDGTMRFTISATGEVTTGQQILKFSHLQARNATLRQQVVDERNVDDPRRQFSIAARGADYEGVTVDINESSDRPGLLLRDVNITSHYLATNRISLPGQEISIAYDPDDDGEFEGTFG